MKKILVFVLVVILALALNGCGNYDWADTNYEFDYAVVQWPDGTMKKIEIDSWTDYDGEQLQITGSDGNVYLVNSFNCVLVNEKEK